MVKNVEISKGPPEENWSNTIFYAEGVFAKLVSLKNKENQGRYIKKSDDFFVIFIA